MILCFDVLSEIHGTRFKETTQSFSSILPVIAKKAVGHGNVGDAVVA
jgi:hypothetical protein